MSSTTAGTSRSRRAELWATRTVWGRPVTARVVLGLGLLSIASAILPPFRDRLYLVAEVLPRFAPGVAAGATVAVGALLLVLAGGLNRGKRRAWQVATAASALMVVLHLAKGLDVEEAALSAAVLGLLVVTRQAFPGAPDPRSRRATLTVLLVGLLTAGLTGAATIALRPREVLGPLTVGGLAEHVGLGLIGIEGPLRFVGRHTGERVSVTLLLLGVVVLGVTLATALRPAGGPHPVTGADRVRLRELVQRHGERDSLAYFALRDDKAVIFSASGKAAVSYAVIGGVSLASGDPLGDPEAWPGAIAAWLEEARSYAWVPAVLAAGERGAQAYHRAGLDALELGDEAVLEVAGFSLQGRPMRGVRQAVTRLQRAGATVSVHRLADLTAEQADELGDLADRWRDGAVERGFSMALGRVGDPEDADSVIVVARDGDGDPRGLLVLVPWGRTGLSLDLMRRSPQAENGVVELMVSELVRVAPDLGIQRVSLNFAVFRSAFERGGRLGAGPVLRLWHRVLVAAGRVWQLESLYRANAKYLPAWQPRYLCFTRARDVPRIVTAALEAEAFIARPRWVRRLVG